jgi:aerobic-type carbon monoxide dehydrogenase small subunit (CoxS/CutS family)
LGNALHDKEKIKNAPESLAEDPNAQGLTRRSFLRGATGATLGAAALSLAAYESSKLAQPQLRTWPRKSASGPYQPHYADITLNINGSDHRMKIPHHRSLLLVLREDLAMTGTKKSCNLGQCGACTVLMDGLPVYSCFLLAINAVGKRIETIESLSNGSTLHPVQQAFVKHMGSQCGHCTPGMIMSAVGLLRQNSKPTEADVRYALSGNLCRCGNYPNEVKAVLNASEQINRKVDEQNPKEFDQTALAAATVIIPRNSSLALPSPSGIPVLDARPKATGEARYAGDIGWHADDPVQRPLIAKVIRSPYALATIGEIDDSEARKLPEYRGMVTFRDIPQFQKEVSKPSERSPAKSDRVFLNSKARYVGDAIAAIAADDLDTALQAIQCVHVDFHPQRAFPDAEFNLAHDVRAIQPGSVAGFGRPQPADKPTIEYKRGDVNAGFSEADVIIEGRYETPIQFVPIEPHAVIAQMNGDRVTFWDSQQSIFAAQDVLASALGIPRENVRIVSQYVGGGFGGKCTDTLGKTCYQAIAAVLSRKTGRPVRLEYTLKELMFAEDTRNPFVFYLKTGVKRDGTITAIECKAIQRTGGYASSGPAVVSVAGEAIIMTYRVPNYWYHGYSVYTSSPVGGEFRGFGHPQAIFARESHVDEVAAAIGMDPLEFRRKNSLHTGDTVETSVMRQVKLMDVAPEQCLKAGADAIGWSRWGAARKEIGPNSAGARHAIQPGAHRPRCQRWTSLDGSSWQSAPAYRLGESRHELPYRHCGDRR